MTEELYNVELDIKVIVLNAWRGQLWIMCAGQLAASKSIHVFERSIDRVVLFVIDVGNVSKIPYIQTMLRERF